MSEETNVWMDEDGAADNPAAEADEPAERDPAARDYHANDSMLMALSRQWGNTPWYLSSLGIHCFVFMLLLLFAPAPKAKSQPTITVKSELEEIPVEEQTEVIVKEEKEETQEVQEQVELKDVSITTELPITQDFSVETDTSSDLQDNTSFATMGMEADAPAVLAVGGGRPGGARTFTTRTDRNQKKRNLNKYGGDALSEKAVSDGLAWLARNQKADGSWQMHPYYPDHKRLKSNAGLTSLCMLAFLGAGNTVEAGKYKRNVRKAEEYLLSFKYAEGGRTLPAPLAFEAPLMLMALAESYGMGSGSSGLKKKVQALVEIGLEGQLDNGGFPEEVTDITGGWHNTTWWLSALKSARQAGFKVPDSVFERSFAEMYRCIQFESGDGSTGVSASAKLYANVQEKPGSPRNEGGSVSKMVASMVVYLLNSLRGTGLEDEQVKGMCNLMALAGTNRNGIWDWPGGNIGLADTFSTKWFYLPEMFERPDGTSFKLRNTVGLPNYYSRSAAGFPDGLWGKPGFTEKFNLATQGDRLKIHRSWYGACYWYWQGYSFSRLGEDTEYWKAWNNNFKPYLIYTQAKSNKEWPKIVTVDNGIAKKLEAGDIEGSWPGVFLRDGCEPFDEMGQAAATAFCVMMLEVYYRY